MPPRNKENHTLEMAEGAYRLPTFDEPAGVCCVFCSSVIAEFWHP